MSASGEDAPEFDTPAGERLVAQLRRKPLTPRRAAVIIASYTTVVTFVGGLLAWLTDRKDFESLGDGLWWALQSVTTVGYGDVVPSSGAGRVIGAFVIVSGIAALTVITAAVTAALIESARRRQSLATGRDDLPELMRNVSARLTAIEARLDELEPRRHD